MDVPTDPVYYAADEEPSPGEMTDEAEPRLEETGTAPPPRRRRRTMLVAIGVAVLVVAGAMGFLFLSGAGPFAHSSQTPGVTTSGQSYRSALAAANQSAAAYGSVAWAPLFAAGVDMPSPVLESTAVPSTLFGSGCPGTATAPTATVTFDGFSGALSSGTSPDWMFMLLGQPETILVVVVLNGQGTVLEQYTGSGCTMFTGSGGVPSTAVDSTAVVQTFLSGGGTAFIGQHPGGFLTMDVFGAYGIASWHVGYSTCPENPATTSTGAHNYSGTYFVGNGSAAAAPVTTNSPHCAGLDLTGGGALDTPGLVPLSAVLGLSAVSGTVTATGTEYSLNVTQGASYLVWNQLTFSILNASGGVVTGTLYDLVTITEPSGCVIATGTTDAPIYTAPTSGGCPAPESGGSAPVASGQRVTISNAASLPGATDTLRISGAPTYRGLVNETIPALTTVLTPLWAGLGLAPVSMTAGGTRFSVNITSAATGLILPEVSFQVFNSTGLPAVGPYFVTVYSSAGCEIANTEMNSTNYVPPIFYGCSTGTGATAPFLVGDWVTISTLPALTGQGYSLVAYGHNLYNSSIVEPFSGVVTPLPSSVSIGSVVAQNTSLGYTYTVNVTSASSALEWRDVAVGVNTTGGIEVSGPTGITIQNASGCDVATALPNSGAYSAPTTNACSGLVLGASAPVLKGEKIVLLSSTDLVGFTTYATREEFQLQGLDLYGGTVFTPIPITGGLLFDTLGVGTGNQGPDAGGYHYNLSIQKVQGTFLVDNLAVGAVNGTFAPVTGPYLVNLSSASGCVLATGPANSTAYTVPTSNACASGALGAQTQLVVGDILSLYTTAKLPAGSYFALYGHGTHFGTIFFAI